MMVNYLVLNESNLVDIYENELDLLIEKNKEKIDNYVKNSDLFLRQDFMKLFNGYIEKNKINSYEHLRQNCKLATCIQGIINGFGGNVYDQVIKQADQKFAAGKPFYDFVMNTSNHRPYTYPEGKIDIPSGSGREGAVKYTDYEISQFFKKIRNQIRFDYFLGSSF